MDITSLECQISDMARLFGFRDGDSRIAVECHSEREDILVWLRPSYGHCTGAYRTGSARLVRLTPEHIQSGEWKQKIDRELGSIR